MMALEGPDLARVDPTNSRDPAPGDPPDSRDPAPGDPDGGRDPAPGERKSVRREVEVAASPEEVWEAIATEEGRRRWLEESERDVSVELIEFPNRLAWWWAGPEEPATRVDFRIVAAPAGSRVIVTESAPVFPLRALAVHLEAVLA